METPSCTAIAFLKSAPVLINAQSSSYCGKGLAKTFRKSVYGGVVLLPGIGFDKLWLTKVEETQVGNKEVKTSGLSMYLKCSYFFSFQNP